MLILGRSVFANFSALRGVVRNRMLLEKGNGIADRDGRAGRLNRLFLVSGDRHRTVTDPAALDETNDRAGVPCQNGRSAFPKHNRMAQQKDFRGERKLLEFGLLDGKHGAGGAVLDR